MNRVNALLFGQSDDAGDVEIGFDWALSRTNLIGFVGLKSVQSQAVFLRIDSDGTQAKFSRGAKNPNGDFAAIRTNNFRMGLFFLIMEPARSLRETPYSFTRARLKHLFRFAGQAI
jgi:hypothetical protein